MRIIYFTFFLVIFSPALTIGGTFPDGFIFGVANAPGQVEDYLPDIWLDWGKQGNIRTWNQTKAPENRLQFWTKPEIELNLAQELGANSFRLGVDWGRVMPKKDYFDEQALLHYLKIIKMAKAKDMSIMLTLMHHSVPKWVQEKGGWHNIETKQDFIIFSKKIISLFHDHVDWWITFNEANVFVTMAYTAGIWPPGEKRSPLSMSALGPFRGDSIKAMDHMSDSHNEIYDWAHKKFPKIKMGLAHNMANYTGKSFIDRMKASFISKVMNWRFPENVRGRMDFFGFNYYGAEWIRGTQVDIDPDEEYSEAGRAIDVNGLYDILKEIHIRFKDLPIIITENGIADAKDAIRPAYHIEHLLAVQKAIQEKIPVIGYYVWSLTDNLEWSDGYCPKFGLVAVDRLTMERKPRMSFDVMKTIIQTRSISPELQKTAWDQVLSYQGKDRPFCRDHDGITSYDEPKIRQFVKKDWRFNR
jgi:beta-glucosidase/6-phospho-beta-glucosidase/beta-galactosidase